MIYIEYGSFKRNKYIFRCFANCGSDIIVTIYVGGLCIWPPFFYCNLVVYYSIQQIVGIYWIGYIYNRVFYHTVYLL